MRTYTQEEERKLMNDYTECGVKIACRIISEDISSWDKKLGLLLTERIAQLQKNTLEAVKSYSPKVETLKDKGTPPV